ncbi:uncharacterized protein LOC111620777 [Centruroides sculpturatus]|uniref:uncharacterized protein LOC111620777 n=1 Tax=Centruroides sculpturatus TaxID=218467 RepID=UPI000C6E3F8D|nr:uncharacterized protein LOC111620777 [Centruroides sculpturatus]
MVYNGRKNKLTFDLELSAYETERENLRIYQLIIRLFILVSYPFMLIVSWATISILIYKRIEERANYIRATVCAIFMNLCVLYEATGLLWIISITTLILTMIMKRFHVLSNDLQRAKTTCSYDAIQQLITKHNELCEFLNQINDKWSQSLFFLYGFIITFVSFLLYNTVFPGFPAHLYVFVCLATAVSISGAITISLIVSRVSSAAYDSFQEIRKLGAGNFRLEEKLKMLDFMKKFRENEIGFSCGDCFMFSKETAVEVYNALYTVFNMLLQIRDIWLGVDSKCVASKHSISPLNATETVSQK